LKLNYLPTNSDWIATYSGEGILTLEDKRTILCTFEAGQLKNGEVLLLCGLPPPPALPAFSPYVPPHKFEGTNAKDFQVSTRGNISIVDFDLDYTPNTHSENWVIYHLSEMMVQMTKGKQVDSLRFGLTNFLFDDPFVLRLEREGELMMFSFEPIKEYSRVMQRVRILKSIDVTCEVIGNIALDRDTERLEQAVDDLCYLLSVTQGTKIQWVYCDQYDKSGTLILRIHASRVAKVYSPLSIINRDSEVKTFIEKTYTGYVANRELYKLNLGTIDAYLDAKAEPDYLQMRGIKLAVVMEMLKDVFLKVPDVVQGGEFILIRETFHSLRSLIENPLRYLLSAMGVDEGDQDEIYNKIDDLNRRSFKTILKSVLKYIGLEIAKNDLDLFITCRNSLVHRGRFFSETALPKDLKRYKVSFDNQGIEEYYFLVSVLDKVFLKLLGYSGHYSDWSSPSNPIRRELA